MDEAASTSSMVTDTESGTNDDKVNLITSIKRQKMDVADGNTQSDVHLLEESTTKSLPYHVSKILPTHKTTSPTETLAFLVFATALESGFIPLPPNYTRPLNITSHSIFQVQLAIDNAVLPQNFYQTNGCMKIQLQLTSIDKDPCLLYMVPRGDSLLVSLTTNHCYGKSVCLPLTKYVPIQNAFVPLTERLRNLKALSLKLKDSLYTPVRNHLGLNHEISYPGLLGLPPEVFGMIIELLDCKSYNSLMIACRRDPPC